jgi:release factor glutamine methyltransferase
MGKYTISQMVSMGARVLAGSGASTPRLDAELILSSVLGGDRLYIYMNPELIPDDDKQSLYAALINERKKGKPVQYIIGRQEFMGLNFRVGPQVLIPRPDTEILVETVIKWFNQYHVNNNAVVADTGTGNAMKVTDTATGNVAKMADTGTGNAAKVAGSNGGIPLVADIGTGSGAIAVSLAYYIDSIRLVATDMSAAALKLAVANAADNGVGHRIEFVQGSLFEPIKSLGLMGRLDAVVSNPPYIPTGCINDLQRELGFEPVQALDGGPDGLSFYRAIAAVAADFLVKGGLLALEIGYNQAGDVIEIIESTRRFGPVKVVKDLEHRDRVVFCTSI